MTSVKPPNPESVSRGLLGAGGRRSDRDRPARSPVTSPSTSTGAICATDPTRSPRSTRPPITGSPATAWCTALRCGTGKARWYRNRWVRTPGGVRRAREARRQRPQSACRDAVSVGANTNVLSHAGRTLALVEGGVANYELTDELDTVGPCDFDGTLAGGYTAHPHRDPAHRRTARGVLFVRARTNRAVLGDRHPGPGPPDRRHRGDGIADDARLLADRQVRGDLRPAGDLRPGAGVAGDQCRAGCGLPARLVLQSVIGRVRIPGPITALANRDERPTNRAAVRVESELSGAHRGHAPGGSQS